MAIVAFAAKGPKGLLERFEYEPSELGPDDVEIAITHCGICHSDLHLIDDDWGISQYPLIPGHEIIGLVEEIGTAVRGLEKGQRVGVGWQRSSCLRCEFCLSGHENFCAEQQATCVGHPGGFADAIRVDSRFVFAVPESLSSENAAPLFCGGVTVYAPLAHLPVRPSMKVGVVGVGGLGHLAIQFANAFGCEVTAFSSTTSKESDARFFGADWFIDVTDTAQIKAATGSLDLVLSTVHVDLDWRRLLNTLRPRGTLCFVGASPGPLEVSPFSLIVGGRSVSGSSIGGRSILREMLEFAARHGVEARTEVFPMSRVNDALAGLREGRARYRIVLKN